ncbi:ferritin-like domain-containing protein [Marivirga sp.]|uniref:ferritin-like domain-containing protein n=1 Tax=Marivirga sp. TaxID=2018662 RepID=UPI002D7FA4F6|nr:ferritin-like domain-containing protein [Marivirga sp.]HET8859523.1 ferritin-like domain-containing protein [Marivirga sp.]
MNIIKFLDQLSFEGGSKEDLEVLSSRREAFTKLSGFSKKMAISAIPTGILASMPGMLSAKSSAENTMEVLNFALTLEYLEYEFYQKASESGVYNEQKVVFDQIKDHEEAHVAFLTETINAMEGGSAVAKPTFDFTGGKGGTGPFDPFNDYAQFLALSQAFEDTGVRAYKGQAAKLVSDSMSNLILTAALSIHGVEARHASMVRRLRGQKGWITGEDTSVPEAALAVYQAGDPADQFPSEANVTQAGVNLEAAFVGNVPNIDRDSIQEAFDEPLDANVVMGTGTVYDIVGLFIVPE